MDSSKELAMLANVDIQRLSPHQWEEYKELRLRALKNEPQAFLSPYSKESAYPDEKWQQRLRDVGDGKNWILFARNFQGKLVGMVGGFRDDNGMQNHSAEIWGVYVDPEMQGKGVAKTLMAAILEELSSDSDIYTINLGVNTDQESAKKLYESFGFKTTATDGHIMGDGKEHMISNMQKSLKND